MKKKVTLAILVTSMLMSNMTCVYATQTQTLELGQAVEVEGEYGTYCLSIDNAHEVDWERAVEDRPGTKMITVQGIVENIDYYQYGDADISSYRAALDGMIVADQDGFALEFYDISSGDDGVYEVSADIVVGSKKKVSFPYYAPEECSSVIVTIGGTHSIEIPLNGEANSESEESEPVSVTNEEFVALQEENSTLKEQNTELQEQVTALTEENEKLKKQIEELSSEITSEESEGVVEEATTEVAETEVEESETTETEVTAEPVVYTDVLTIRLTQEALNAAGYNCGTPDGIAGAKTTQALTNYQTAQGIAVNGQVTDEVLGKLGIVEKVQKAVELETTKGEYATGYTYDQLARNPDTYMLQKMKFSGEVLQADSSGGTNYMRLAMNSDYDTVLFVTYEDDVIDYRLLEDDKVTIYGQSFGLYSYEAVSGATITIPWIEASIIEMN